MVSTEPARLPADISSKSEFYDLVCEQLEALLGEERNWITNLSNASSLLFWAFRDSHFFGAGEGAVNWCGFYLDSSFFPSSGSSTADSTTASSSNAAVLPKPSNGVASTTTATTILQLGPFQGRPACLVIPARPGGGVCADAFCQRLPLLVRDVHEYPGHIPCDGDTNSEVVVPLVVEGRALGVLDLDCLRVGGFGEEDATGLQRVAEIVVRGCDWPGAESG